MQTRTEIRRILTDAGLSPNRRLGQCFMIDKNLLGKVLELADPPPGSTVLEVGPGTGTLTEELLRRVGRLVAVEIDRGLAAVVRQRFCGRENLVLIEGDVLAGKHAISPTVKAELGQSADMIANLPYNIATPLVAECLIESWGAACGRRPDRVRFGRMTFTVQQEVADRLTARPGRHAYGPVSILIGLLGRLTAGPRIPASAFWPEPNVTSRALRIDFDESSASEIRDVEVLRTVVSLAFAHRRKQIGWILKRPDGPFAPEALRSGMEAAGITLTWRAQKASPEQFRTMANELCSENPDN